MVLVEHVSVAIDGTPVLHDVSFRIETGTVAGYVGPNGAGKTTTMRLLTGALKPDTGRVEVGGVDVALDPLGAKRRFGFVPEHGHLYESFTPTEYLAFIGRMHGIAEPTLASRSAAHLRFWGLAGAAQQSMTGFSKGMKQKVLLSAAMLHDPPVLLLDEPLNGLDAHAVQQFRAILRAQAAVGKTVFYSSHLLDAVERIADQVIVIRSGQIVTDGTPEEVMAEAGGGTLEDAFSRLTATADADEQAAWLEREAFGRDPSEHEGAAA
ncbi:MAG TPA: ABC transporter ATP-binding protein [Rubricoccaceae bacterium]